MHEREDSKMSDHGRNSNGDAHRENAAGVPAASAASATATATSAADVFEDSRSKPDLYEYQRGSSRIREDERESSKCIGREKEEERGQECERGSSKSRDMERDRDREHHTERNREGHHNRDHRQRSERRAHDRDAFGDRRHQRDDRQRSERRQHNGDGSNGRSHHRDHRDRGPDDYDRWSNREPRDRSRDSHMERESRHKHRSESYRTSPSCSQSESKRVSGFDMAPSGSTMMPLATGTGPITGTTTPPVPGMFPNAVHYMSQQATRHARRVYVGGLSPMANEQTVATFFSQVMSAIGGNSFGPGDAVVNVYINQEKKFAFVEMRTVEEASNAMALDGIIFEGAPVKVRRPSDYNPSLAAALGPGQPSPNLNIAAVGLTLDSSSGLEGPDRIFVCGFPYYFTEDQIKELFETFGPLRSFVLIKDRETGNSKGYAFCVYQNLSVIDIACAALNGMKMGDKTLTVRRANQTSVQPRPEQENVLMDARQQVANQMLLYLPTKVVCLLHVVSEDDLNNDENYEDLMEDMKDEGGKYGKLVNVVIPRPGPNGEATSGVKRVFLEYEETTGSVNARQSFNGRKFAGNHAVANFYPEDKYAQGDFDS